MVVLKKMCTVNFVKAVLQKQMAANIVSHSFDLKAAKMTARECNLTQTQPQERTPAHIVAARYSSVLIKGVSSF